MRQEQEWGNVDNMSKEVLNEVIEVLMATVEDKRAVVPVKVSHGDSKVQDVLVKREQHLEDTMGWAIDYISGNIDTDN